MTEPEKAAPQKATTRKRAAKSEDIEATAVVTVTEPMTNTGLPNIPAPVNAPPVASVIGTRAPATWETKDWTSSTDKPNISTSGRVGSMGMQGMTNATLTATANVVNIQRTIDAWAPKGWLPTP
jgi:hypothetical protein